MSYVQMVDCYYYNCTPKQTTKSSIELLTMLIHTTICLCGCIYNCFNYGALFPLTQFHHLCTTLGLGASSLLSRCSIARHEQFAIRSDRCGDTNSEARPFPSPPPPHSVRHTSTHLSFRLLIWGQAFFIFVVIVALLFCVHNFSFI